MFIIILEKLIITLWELTKLKSNPKAPGVGVGGKHTQKHHPKLITQEKYKSALRNNVIFQAIITMSDKICKVYSFLQQSLCERNLSADWRWLYTGNAPDLLHDNARERTESIT